MKLYTFGIFTLTEEKPFADLVITFETEAVLSGFNACRLPFLVVLDPLIPFEGLYSVVVIRQTGDGYIHSFIPVALISQTNVGSQITASVFSSHYTKRLGVQQALFVEVLMPNKMLMKGNPELPECAE